MFGVCRRKGKKPKSLADSFGELLEQIDSEIRATEERLLRFRAGHTSVSRGLILYGIAAYGCILAFAYLYTPDPRVVWQRMAKVGLVMGFPLLIFVIKKLVDCQYGRAITKETQRLAKLSKKRADTCADLESKTDWKKLAKLLGKPDAPPPQLQQQQQQQQRHTTGRPANGKGGAAGGVDVKHPGTAYIPPVSAFVPKSRTLPDKFVDYILGDGPNNRFALICTKCFTHNGLARGEEVAQVRYRCTACGFLNGPPLAGAAAAAAAAAAAMASSNAAAGAGAGVPPTPMKGAATGGASAPATPKSGGSGSGSDIDTADSKSTAAAAAAGAAGAVVPGSAMKQPPSSQPLPPSTPSHAGTGAGPLIVPVVNGVPFVKMTSDAYNRMTPQQQSEYNAWLKTFKAHVAATPKATPKAGAAAAATAAATPGGPAATPARQPSAALTDTPAPAQAPATK